MTELLDTLFRILLLILFVGAAISHIGMSIWNARDASKNILLAIQRNRALVASLLVANMASLIVYLAY